MLYMIFLKNLKILSRNMLGGNESIKMLTSCLEKIKN